MAEGTGVGTSLVPPDHLQRLRDAIHRVHPGQTVKTATLAHGGLIIEPDTLREAVRTDPACRAAAYCSPNGRVVRRRLQPAESGQALIDLNNVAWTLRARTNTVGPPVARLVAVVAALRALGVIWVGGIGDANLSYAVADPDALSTLERELDLYRLAPRGTRADELLLAEADARGAWILSNDRFRDWKKSGGRKRRDLWRLTFGIAARADGFDLGELAEELTHEPCEQAPPRSG